MEYKASVFYEGGEVTYTFPFYYLKKRFVKVRYRHQDGTFTNLNYGTDYTVSDHMIYLSVAGSAEDTINIYRQTPTNQIVKFTDASVLRAYDLNVFQIQLLHIAEEENDTLLTAAMIWNDVGNVWDAKGRRIVNVGDPVDPQDVVTQASLENTLHEAGASATEAAASAEEAKGYAQDALRHAENAAHSEAQSEDILNAVAGYVDDAHDAALSAQAYSAPQWDETKDYVAGEVVTYSDGSSYRALVDNTGIPCTDVSTWKLITTYMGDDFFEIDMSGNLMPAENPSYSTTWELDGDGNIQPKAAGV